MVKLVMATGDFKNMIKNAFDGVPTMNVGRGWRIDTVFGVFDLEPDIEENVLRIYFDTKLIFKMDFETGYFSFPELGDREFDNFIKDRIDGVLEAIM